MHLKLCVCRGAGNYEAKEYTHVVSHTRRVSFKRYAVDWAGSAMHTWANWTLVCPGALVPSAGILVMFEQVNVERLRFVSVLICARLHTSPSYSIFALVRYILVRPLSSFSLYLLTSSYFVLQLNIFSLSPVPQRISLRHASFEISIALNSAWLGKFSRLCRPAWR